MNQDDIGAAWGYKLAAGCKVTPIRQRIAVYGVQYGVYKEDRLTCKPGVIEGNEKTVGGHW